MGGALANAVADALGDSGSNVNVLPITPEKVWQWLTPMQDKTN
jgi:CO/xanthine dehydrogenase Mo-binding subunit